MVELELENVKCGGCVAAIENGLQSFDDVKIKSITTDGKLKIEADSSRLEDVKIKLEDIGYPVKS